MIKDLTSRSNEEDTYQESSWIDIIKYFEPLMRQWQWIVLCALVFGLVVFAKTYFDNRFSLSYKAVALVASAKSATTANFGSDITSATDTQLQLTSGGAVFYDPQTRLQSYITQVKNGDIADQVLQEIGPSLNRTEGQQITATDLLDLVSADLVPKTDTIAISATYGDPVLASEIANSWSKAFVDRINALYGGALSGTAYQVTATDVSQAKTAYEAANQGLGEFIASDKAGEYKSQVDDITSTNIILRGAASSLGDQQVQDHLDLLKQVYTDRRQTSQFLDNANSLRSAVSNGGEPAAISNALALTMLKTQIYAAYEGTNTLQVQNLPEAIGANIATVDAVGMVSDLDALISTLQKRLTDLNKQIETLSSEVQDQDYLMNFANTNTPIVAKIQENEQKIRDLNSLISTQTGKLDELTLTRDLAWKSYSALATKATEISSTFQNVQVVLAAPAIPPMNPTGNSATFSGGIAAAVGLILGALVAYAYEIWQNYKKRQPEVITNKMVLFAKRLIKKPGK